MNLPMPRRPLELVGLLPTGGDRRGPFAWITRLLAETAWPPASDIWLKDPNT
jgi:hypothetical protein